MQQQQQSTGEQESVSFAARRFHAKQAVGIGLVLIIVGCFSILFNAADLAVGTGISAYSSRYDWSPSYKLLSRISFGLVSHGIWCGLTVSQSHGLFSEDMHSHERFLVLIVIVVI